MHAGSTSVTVEISAEARIDQLVASMPLAADVLRRFGLHCAGCGISKYETLEQGVSAHGLRIEPVLVALEQARDTGRIPEIAPENLIPLRRAPGAFERRSRIAHVIPIMSGKGGVGKSLTTSLLAVAMRRRNLRRNSGCRHHRAVHSALLRSTWNGTYRKRPERTISAARALAESTH